MYKSPAKLGKLCAMMTKNTGNEEIFALEKILRFSRLCINLEKKNMRKMHHDIGLKAK